MTEWLTSCFTALDLTITVKLFTFIIGKSDESKQNRQEVSCTVKIPLKLVFSDQAIPSCGPGGPGFEPQAPHLCYLIYLVENYSIFNIETRK